MALKSKLKTNAVVPTADSETLPGKLSDVVNELHQLIELAPDEKTEELLRRQRRIYFALWEEVIRQEIDQATPLYRAAIASLKAALKAATDAKADIEKITAAIKKAVAAAKTVDKIVQLGIKYLA